VIRVDPEQRWILGATCLLMASLAALLFGVLRRQQRRLAGPHPGWILAAGVTAYGIYLPLVLALGASADTLGLADLVAYFSFEGCLFLAALYCLVLLGFLAASSLPLAHRRERIAHTEGPRTAPWLEDALAIVFLVVGGAAFWHHFEAFGGFSGFLAMNRSTAYEQMSQEGGVLPADPFVATGFLLLATRTFGQEPVSRWRWVALMFGIGVYGALVLATGSRLVLLKLVLAVSAVIVFLQPEWAMRYRRRVALVFLGMLGFLVWYQTGRIQVAYWLINGEWPQLPPSSVDFSKQEPATGYVPGLIVLANGTTEFQIDQWNKVATFMPGDLAAMLGVDRPPALSRLLSQWQLVRAGNSVYTVTLPVDLWLGLGVALVPVAAGLLWWALSWTVARLWRVGGIATLLAATIWADAAFIVRVEAGNWISKLVFDLATTGAAVGIIAVVRSATARHRLAMDRR